MVLAQKKIFGFKFNSF